MTNPVIGIALVAEQLSNLKTKLSNATDVLKVVGIATDATCVVSTVELLLEVTLR